MKRASIAAAILVQVIACAFAAGASNIDEIRTLMTSGDYAGANLKIDSALFPSNIDPAEKYQLLMFKGECRLQMKDRIGSSTAFKSAAKVAGNINEFAAAQANALIVLRSSGGQFTPRIQGGTPMDVMNIDARKQGMIAMQNELASQNKSAIEAALRATQLPPIEQVFTKVGDMYCLEMFARGDARDTEKTMRELGTRAFNLMHAELSKVGGRIDNLANIANSSGGNARGWDTGRLGLTSQQRDEVKAAIPYLTQIRDRASEYRKIAAKLGGNENQWDALVADAVASINDAESLYNDR